eukprot:CAMPEP_0181268638 /NCGR_PEP_ID=MMETSP1097-20121128/5652_1 /TAXON_ID=35684 /ORGANISM="Pseudopedinella elastica, Strain CCMP716" /LENGTH=87 /DNA_ID=CAMNT_0023368369 /DNA_START=144 /DNA_END=404 /DNA_ORIENTATION=-
MAVRGSRTRSTSLNPPGLVPSARSTRAGCALFGDPARVASRQALDGLHRGLGAPEARRAEAAAARRGEPPDAAEASRGARLLDAPRA